MNSPFERTTDLTSEIDNSLNQAASLFSSGQPHEALAVVTRVLEWAPRNGVALNIAGACAHRLGRLKDAEDYWHRALNENPDNADVNNNLGILLKDMKRFPEAEAAFRRALEIRPLHAQAHYNLGNLFYETNCFPEAEAAYRQALAIRPDWAEFHYKLGNLLYQTKRLSEAEAAYRQVLAIRPDCVDTYTNLGSLLCKTKRFPEAEAACRRALEIQPDHANAHVNLGIVLKEMKRLPEAEAAYLQALATRPDLAEAHANLGNLLMEAKRFPEAEVAYRRALTLRPDRAATYSNLGNLLYEAKRFARAEEAYRRTLSIQSDYGDARWNLGLLLLHTGRFSEGWPLYEARYDEKNSSSCVRKPAVDYPQWQGESLEGKSVAVHCELGFGDTIQFARYFPLLKALGASHITVVCQRPLRTLVEGIDGADTVLVPDEMASLPAHDYWTFLLSLPLHFATTLDSIPNTIPYVQPTADRLDVWKTRLPESGLRIGLVWKGNPRHQNDRNRSLPSLAALAPLWDVPGAHFISLQKGQAEDEAATPPPSQPLIHLGTDIEDFADSAAIIAQLDLVICVDTAIAHLAGALGKPCWVLLPRVGTDWRWLEERTDSPWYPGTMRLFRQRDLDDWTPTILEVAKALHRFTEAAGATATAR